MSTIDNAMAGYKPPPNRGRYMGARRSLTFLAPLAIYKRLLAYGKANRCTSADTIRAALDKFLPPTP